LPAPLLVIVAGSPKPGAGTGVRLHDSGRVAAAAARLAADDAAFDAAHARVIDVEVVS